MCHVEIEVGIGVLVRSRPQDLWLVALVVVVFFAMCACLPAVNINDSICAAGALLQGGDISLGSLELLVMRWLGPPSCDPGSASMGCWRWSQHDPCAPH